MRTAFIFALLAAAGLPAFAAEQPGAPSSGGLFQVFLVLLFVLALMIGAAWLMKKLNVPSAMSGSSIKIIGGVAVGNKERIMVIEVADQWIVIGVTAAHINALSTMPKQEAMPTIDEPHVSNSFSNRLKQFIDKRNGK